MHSDHIEPLLLTGAPGSPYTRKMVALLRFRRLPYELITNIETRPDLPKPKVQLLPTFFLPKRSGELEAVVDSTPLIRRFDHSFSRRRVIPCDPAVAFIDALLEDYGDEWLTKAMFHYRWYYQADIERAGEVLPRWRAIDAPEVEIQQMKQRFQKRQISRLYVVGSNDTTAPVIESSYQRFLALFAQALQRQPFLAGARPGAADFAVYGQLTQLTQFDPTPMALAYRIAPRVCAWTQLMEDLSGLAVEGEQWLQRDLLRDHLGDLLEEVGRVYVPVLLANHAAIESGAKLVETTVDGRAWVQQPYPYQAKCLMNIRLQFHELDKDDKAVALEVLSGSGCEQLFNT